MQQLRSADHIIDVKFSDPGVKNFKAVVWYTNGSKETISIEHSDYIETNGRFVVELRDAERVRLYPQEEARIRAWQERWANDPSLRIDVRAVDRGRAFYNLVEFPYPSAEGLHVGHVRTYAGADVHGRWQRMRGRHVFQPMGFDSFGIHTENYALRTGRHPGELTDEKAAEVVKALPNILPPKPSTEAKQ